MGRDEAAGRRVRARHESLVRAHVERYHGTSTSGKFSFRPPEFVYVFLTEPMKNPSDSEMYAEILGSLDEGAVDSLTRDIVQLYRR